MKHERREARSHGDTTYGDVKAPVLAPGSTVFEVFHVHRHNACFWKGLPSGSLDYYVYGGIKQSFMCSLHAQF